MITTTLAVIALAGGLGAGNVPSPNWQKDYSKALAVASSESKPIAVFISSGAATPARMVVDGRIPANAAQLLSEKYVCVFVDTDTESGKTLAGQFELTEGLVISGPGGQVQALRHNGAVAGAELAGKLTQFASTGQPTTTVNTGLSTYQPTYRVAPTYYVNPYGGAINCVGLR